MNAPLLSLDRVLRPPKPKATTAPQSRYYVPALDGLRVLAFLGVFVCHTLTLLPRVQGNPFLTAIWTVGAFGVPLFFALSAFLITRLLLMERERTGGVDLRAYYVRRTLRIWPLYFLVAAVGLALDYRMDHVNVGQSLLALTTFTANWALPKGHLCPTLGPLWSLSIEEQFYMVWPLVLARLSPRGLTRLCVAMVGVALASRLGFALHDHNYATAGFATTSHLDSLALGTLLALNVDRLRSFSRSQGGALMLLCVGGMLAVNLIAPSYGPHPVLSGLLYTAVPFLCVAILALAMGTPGTFLARPRLATLGKLTFGLYMWHLMPLNALKHYTLHPGPLPILACLGVALAMASLTYYAVERPFLNLKHRFGRARTPLAAQVA